MLFIHVLLSRIDHFESSLCFREPTSYGAKPLTDDANVLVPAEREKNEFQVRAEYSKYWNVLLT